MHSALLNSGGCVCANDTFPLIHIISPVTHLSLRAVFQHLLAAMPDASLVIPVHAQYSPDISHEYIMDSHAYWQVLYTSAPKLSLSSNLQHSSTAHAVCDFRA